MYDRSARRIVGTVAFSPGTSRQYRDELGCRFGHRTRTGEESVSAQHARAREIVAILSRNGLGDVVDRFARSGAANRPERVRSTLEELGATWVKLGQILSTRRDLLPPAYQAELAKLQDDAAPVPSTSSRS